MSTLPVVHAIHTTTHSIDITTTHYLHNNDIDHDINKRRVNAPPAIKYQKASKNPFGNSASGHSSPKQGKLTSSTITVPSSSIRESLSSTATLRELPNLVSAGNKASSSSSSVSQHHNNHHHHHHHHHHSNITICPHTYHFPAVEGALVSNSMKGPGYCSSIESGYMVLYKDRCI